MKKIFQVGLMLMMLLGMTATAGAEKSLWKDSDFNFKAYNAVVIGLIDNDYVSSSRNASFDNRAEFKTGAALAKAFGKKNIQAKFNPEGYVAETEEVGGSILRPASFKPIVEATVHKFGWVRYWKEPWVETKTYYDEVVLKDRWGNTIYDRNGHRVTQSIPRYEYIDHPGEWQYTAQVDLELRMIDPRTDKAVAIKTDTRDRSLETDTSGMLERICNDFVKDVTKN